MCFPGWRMIRTVGSTAYYYPSVRSAVVHRSLADSKQRFLKQGVVGEKTGDRVTAGCPGLICVEFG